MLLNFIKIAIRNLWRNPVNFFINTSGLAVGLTFALLIFLWISYEESFDRFNTSAGNIQLFLQNYSSSEGTVQTVEGITPEMKQNILNSTPEIKEITQVYLASRWPNEICFKVKEDQKECVYSKGLYVDSAFLKVFSYKIKRGDPNFLNSEFNIAISEKLAKKLYGDEDPIGKKFKLDTWLEVQIAAILDDVPSNSTFQFDFLMPMNVVQHLRGITKYENWKNYNLNAYALTAPNVDLNELAEKLNNNKLVVTDDDINQGMSLLVYPFVKWHLNDRFENGKSAGGKIEYVHLFSIIALVILFMASVNYVNLSTAKSTTRRKEIGVRKSIGANRFNLALQFFGESFIQVLIALILAIGVTQIILPYFSQIIGEKLFLDLKNTDVQLILASLLFGVSAIAGIYPAMVMASFNPVKALKDKMSREITGSNIVRKILIVVQVAASISIIIFSMILFFQVKYINSKNLGYDRAKTIMVEPTYRLLQKYDEFKADMLKSPSVKNVTLSGSPILNIPFYNVKYDWPGKNENDKIQFKILSCSPDFIDAFGLKLLEGTNFNEEDTTFQVLVTQEAVRRMNLKDPVGTTIEVQNEKARIAGVISDFNTESLHEPLSPVILYSSKKTQMTHLYVKYTGTASKAINDIKNSYNKFESDFSLSYKFLDDEFNKQYKNEIVTSKVSTIFIVISLVIAVVGVIGLSIFNLSGRVKEIAIRKIFGASIPGLLKLVSREFVYLNLIANAIAWPVAWYFARNWLDTFAYRIPMPFVTYFIIGMGITTLTLLIVGYLGIKAARENPVNTLRYE